MSRWQVSLKKAMDAQGQIERILCKLLVITLCDLTLNFVFYFSNLWKPAS